jgi:flagellar basal body-associated protein FliL
MNTRTQEKKMKKRAFLLSVILVLAVVLSACSMGAQKTFPTPTAKPKSGQTSVQPTAQQGSQTSGGPILIENTSSYTDESGNYYVVGLVKNTSSQPLTSITLTLQVRDANGKSLIVDDNGSPVESTEFNTLLTTLAPNEESPVSYYLSPPTGSTPASFKLDYTSSEAATVNRGNLALEHSHFTHDNYGNYYIFGEIVNKSNQPVKINSLAGSLKGSAGKTIAANNTLNLIEYLAAAGDSQQMDRAPFGVMIYAPKGSTEQFDWNVYVDADITDPLSDRGIQFTPQYKYTDSQGSIHIIGVVKHSDTKQLTFPVQGSLTDKDGNIFDTYFYMFPINIGPNTTLPFDLNYWEQINSNETDKAAIAQGYVQTDRSWIWETNDTYILGTEENGAPYDKGNGETQVTGTAINSTGVALKEIVVMIAFADSNNTITGTGYQSLYPSGDTFAINEKVPFDFTVYLDPTQAYVNYSYQIQVIGVQATQ